VTGCFPNRHNATTDYGARFSLVDAGRLHVTVLSAFLTQHNSYELHRVPSNTLSRYSGHFLKLYPTVEASIIDGQQGRDGCCND
jgi:hypothetical protein